MNQSPKYKNPTGFVTNQYELKRLQKQLLWEQYEKNREKKSSRENNESRGLEKPNQRTYSLKNMNNPQNNANSIANQRNSKGDQIKMMLARDLKRQIQQKEQKKKRIMNKRLEKQKYANSHAKQLLDKEMYHQRLIKQKIQKQMSADYEQKMRRVNEKQHMELQQKQRIKQKLQAIQQQFSHKNQKIQSNDDNQMSAITAQLSKSTKSPNYYYEVSDFQMNNYHKYEQKVKPSIDNQTKKMDDIIEERIKQSRRKSQQHEKFKMMQKQMQREELQRVLEQQMKEGERKRQQQKAYDKSKFYSERFEQVYHPIGNPIDSKFSKDNKYVMNELYLQNQRRNSRQNIVDENAAGGGQIESFLARKGSRSLL